MDDYSHVNEFLNNKDNSIVSTAPDELKAFYYRASLHAAVDIFNNMLSYLKKHPKAIDVKVSDIINMPSDYAKEMGKLSIEHIGKMAENDMNRLTEKRNELLKMTEE